MKRYLALTIFILTCAVSHAQTTQIMLVPRTVFVGDPAVLVLQLPPAQNVEDIVLNALSPDFPTDNNIDFHRIVLERRTGGSRLLIEFTAFVPGILELPVIEAGGERFAGLTVRIESIIDTQGALGLSRPASSLAMPGTAFMLYGTMAGIILFLILVVLFIAKGRTLLNRWIEKYKRWRLFVSIKITEKRLRKILQKGGDKRDILDKLSRVFRGFLSALTEKNCRAMTAREFENLAIGSEINGSLLGNFFRRCDELRFSGREINSQDVSMLLDDTRDFFMALRNRNGEEEAA